MKSTKQLLVLRRTEQELAEQRHEVAEHVDRNGYEKQNKNSASHYSHATTPASRSTHTQTGLSTPLGTNHIHPHGIEYFAAPFTGFHFFLTSSRLCEAIPFLLIKLAKSRVTVVYLSPTP
jgi:hypothetical protein